jgi:hypothetical protein
MSFQITGLPRAAFVTLFTLTDAELAPRNAVRMVADKRPGSTAPSRIGRSLAARQAGGLAPPPART